VAIGIVQGELTSMEEIARQDSLRTLQGVRERLEQLGYAYTVMNVPRPHNLSAEHFLSQFGAMIFIESSFGESLSLNEFEERKIPVVVAKLEVDELQVSATYVDHREPMRQAVRTFVSLGHRRIAFIGRDANYGIHGKARAGYLEGLGEAGIPVDESLLAVCAKTDALSGFLAARSLLQSAQPPTAIIAARDSIAEGVMQAIDETGLTVGHHISVIGFDDTTWPEGRDFLTTYREACYEMGAAAADMLIDRITTGWKPPEKQKFEAPFVLRQTVGPCPRQGGSRRLGANRSAGAAADLTKGA